MKKILAAIIITSVLGGCSGVYDRYGNKTMYCAKRVADLSYGGKMSYHGCVPNLF